jgi:hypothetical protein
MVVYNIFLKSGLEHGFCVLDARFYKVEMR